MSYVNPVMGHFSHSAAASYANLRQVILSEYNQVFRLILLYLNIAVTVHCAVMVSEYH